MPAEDFKETVKQQADIVRIIGDYIKLKKAGAQNYSGLCPFHGEKTPSFSVHATRQFYHCFGCGVSGDVFSFVQKIENITFPEAVRLVAQKLGIPLPKATYSSPGEAKDAKLRGAVARRAGAGCRVFPGMPEASRGGAGAGVSGGARAGSKRRSRAFALGTRRIPASCCATAWRASSAKRCCARAGCFRGNRRTPGFRLRASGIRSWHCRRTAGSSRDCARSE